MLQVLTGDIMTFAEALRDLAIKRGWTKYKIAKLTGFSQTTVANWLEGRTVPYPKDHLHIAKALGASPVELFGENAALTLPEQKEKPSPVQGGLTSSEADVIRLFRAASPETQQAMLRFLRSLEADRMLQGDD